MVVIEDREVPIEPGVFVAVAPASARHVRAGADGLVFLAVGASP